MCNHIEKIEMYIERNANLVHFKVGSTPFFSRFESGMGPALHKEIICSRDNSIQ